MGLALGVAAAVGLGAGCWFLFLRQTPQDFVQAYMDCIEARDYEKMYEMLDADSQERIDQESFLTRNQNIYEGIEVEDLKLEFKKKEMDKIHGDHEYGGRRADL